MKKNKRLKSKRIKIKIQVNFRDKFYKSQKINSFREIECYKYVTFLNQEKIHIFADIIVLGLSNLRRKI